MTQAPVRHYPFLRYAASSDALVRSESGPISVERFFGDASALAERLPSHGYVVNLCTGRYRFTVGFLAALLRRQVTLLPSGETPAPLIQLAQIYDSLYFLHDGRFAGGEELICFPYPADLSGQSSGAVPALAADQPAAILFTSGSTGTPVPNPRSWGALVNSTRAAARQIGLSGLKEASLLGTVPHQHSYGLESIVMLALQHGFTFHGSRSLLPANIVRQLEDMPAPRILVTTPIHLRGLVAYDGALPPVHHIFCATAPLASELAYQAEARFAAPLYEIYGCSEVGQIAVRRTVETSEWSCIDGIDLREQDGDVWAAGAAAAAEAPLNDIIELRSTKRFLLHSRKSDMINIAGKRSSLAYLNHHLNAIEGVRDGVFILPDEAKDAGRLAAYVVAPTLSRDAILAGLRLHVDPAFLPRPIHFVPALPRNALGKLTRQAMTILARETVDG